MSVVTPTDELAVTPSLQRRWRRSPTVLVVALVMVPVVATVISLIGRHWYAGDDYALELLRIRDVGTSHTPLLGPWSRWGWAHPGPALYWSLAPFYRLFGETGVLVGMGVLNGAAIAGVLAVAHRRGGVELTALAGLMMALLVRAQGINLVVDTWNPWAAFLPFVLFFMLAWSVLCRDWAMLPLVVFVGSFVVQAHAGYLPFVAVLTAVAVGYALAFAVRHRREPSERRSPAVRWLLATAMVALAMWLPALVQQIFDAHGNLEELASYIRHPGEATAGWKMAFGVLGNELRPVGPWLRGNDDNGFGITASSAVVPGIATVAVMAGAAALAWRRRRRDAARLALTAMLLVALAVLATARLTGGVFVYVTHWWWAVGAVATLGMVWALVSAFDSPLLRRVVTGVAVAGIFVVGVMSASDLPASVPLAQGSKVISTLSNKAEPALSHQSRYLVRSFDPFGIASNGVFLQLEQRGFDVFVEPGQLADLQYGSQRLATPDQVGGILSVIDVGELQGPPDSRSRLIASMDPLSPQERARTYELEVALRAEMGRDAPPGRIMVDSPGRRVGAVFKGGSVRDVDELAALQERGDGYAVYLSPAR